MMADRRRRERRAAVGVVVSALGVVVVGMVSGWGGAASGAGASRARDRFAMARSWPRCPRAGGIRPPRSAPVCVARSTPTHAIWRRRRGWRGCSSPRHAAAAIRASWAARRRRCARGGTIPIRLPRRCCCGPRSGSRVTSSSRRWPIWIAWSPTTPDDPQAWLTRAVVLGVRGPYAEGLASCARLEALASPLVVAACRAPLLGVTGRARTRRRGARGRNALRAQWRRGGVGRDAARGSGRVVGRSGRRGGAPAPAPHPRPGRRRRPRRAGGPVSR